MRLSRPPGRSRPSSSWSSCGPTRSRSRPTDRASPSPSRRRFASRASLSRRASGSATSAASSARARRARCHASRRTARSWPSPPTADTRGASRSGSTTAELGEIPGSVEAIHWSPDGSHLLVLAADLGADRAGAESGTKIAEAGAEAQDPKVFRPAQFWRRLWLVDASLGDTRDVTPDGVNVFEVGWAGGKVGGGLHGRAVGERLVRRVGRPDRPRRPLGRARAYARSGSSRRRGSRRADRSRSSRASRPTAASLTGTVHVVGRGPLAPELRRRRGSSSQTRRRSGSPGGAGPGPSPASSSLDGSVRGARRRRPHARAAVFSPASPSAPTARAPPRRTRAPTSRPRSCSGRTASGGR